MAWQPAIVSARGTLRPGAPVKASVTAKGWVRKRCSRRARLTIRRSSAPSSSTPSSAMMSCRSLEARQRLARALGDAVMRLADDQRIEQRRRGGERIDRGIQALRRQAARQHDDAVHVAGDRGHRGVGEVVGRHIDRLDRGDRRAGDRGDALLQRRDLGRPASAGSRPATAAGRAGSRPRRRPGRSGRRCPSAAARSDACSSRKYSAMVSAVSGVRQRAPGGSFIWP